MFSESLVTSFKVLTGNLNPCKSGEVESETPWKRVALTIQQTLHSNLKDREWGYYKDSDEVFLMRNIGFALFGPPDELPDSSKNKDTGYSAKKLVAIEKMLRTVKENDNHDQMSRERITILASSILASKRNNCKEKGTVMSVIFVVFQVDTEDIEERAVPEPVFRVPNESDGIDRVRYIDRQLNVYRGWNEYLEYNKMPIGRYCYPLDGTYNDENGNRVQFEFDDTPVSKVRKIIELKNFKNDFGDSKLVPSASYPFINFNISRLFFVFANTVMPLVDPRSDGKYTKECPVIVKSVPENSNPVTQDSWQTLDARNLGMIAVGASFPHPDDCQKTNLLTISPATTNCCGVVNLAHFLHGKLKRDALSSEDVAQFSACVLFFTMSAIGENAANKVIKDASEGMVNSLRSAPRGRGDRKRAGGRRVGLRSSTASNFNGRHSGFLLASWEGAEHEPTSLRRSESPSTVVHRERDLLKERDNFTHLIESQSAFTRECADLNLISII